MSGQISSPWLSTNELLAPTVAYDAHQNRLLEQQSAQQTINANEIEQISRASNWVLSQDPENKDPAKQASAYQTAVALLQKNGFAKNAPQAYPGFDAMQGYARMGTPSAEQFKLGQAGTAIPTPGFSTGGTTPAAGGSGTAAAAAPGTIEPEAMSRANAVRDGLMKRGLDYDTATAFAANALHESSANPNTGPGDAGASHGLFQWRGDRYNRYVAKYGHSPDNAPLDEQLDYVLDELNGPESLAKGRIAQAQGPEGKAGEVSQAFLRPKDVAAEMARRSATARQLAALGPAPATPGMTDQQWLQNQGRQYPSLASAGAGTPGQVPAAPGGQATPPPYQVAGPMQPPPTAATAPQNTLTPPLPPAATTAPPAAYATAPTKEAATAQAIATGKPVLIEGGQGAAALPSGRLVANLPDLPTAPPAQPTAAPPPPAVAPVAIPAPPEMDNHNLTREDYQDLERARRAGMTGPQLTQEVQQRQVANITRAHQYQTDVRQAQNEAQARQDKATTQAREAHTAELADRTAARADAEAAQKAKLAGLPYQGSGIEAQDANVLLGGDDGTARYAGAYARQAAPRVNLDGSTVVPNMTAYDKPTYRGGKGQDTGAGGPDYGTVKTTPPTQMNATQSLAAGFADRMRNSLPVISDTSPAAMNRWQQLLGKVPLAGNSLVTPEFQQHLQAERDFINAVLRKESGAAISESEFVNARQQYIPQPGDKPEVLAQKAKNREQVLANLIRDAGPAYKPAEAPASQAAPVTVKTPEEAQALSPGTVYKTPDGKTFKR